MSCEDPDLSHVMNAILTTSFVFYIISAAALAVILVIIVCQKGHCFSFALILAYSIAYCLKGIEFANWSTAENAQF